MQCKIKNETSVLSPNSQVGTSNLEMSIFVQLAVPSSRPLGVATSVSVATDPGQLIEEAFGSFCHSSEGLRQEVRFSCFLGPLSPPLSLSRINAAPLFSACRSG